MLSNVAQAFQKAIKWAFSSNVLTIKLTNTTNLILDTVTTVVYILKSSTSFDQYSLIESTFLMDLFYFTRRREVSHCKFRHASSRTSVC